MPVLSVYIGETYVSALRFTSPEDYEFVHFPYTYSKDLYGHFSDEKSFNNQLIRLLKKSFSKDVSDHEVVTGDVSTVLKGDKQEWVMVNDFDVRTKKNLLADFPFKENIGEEATSFLSNKAIYPHMSPGDALNVVLIDKVIKSMCKGLRLNTSPIVFTGDRFTIYSRTVPHSILLAMDLIKGEGLYEVKIDPANKLPAIALLNEKQFSLNDKDAFKDELVEIGTLLNAPGGVEVLFEVEAGDPQLVELKKGEIFVFPLEKGKTARIVAKSSLGTIETKVRGGLLGLVLDTRDKESTKKPKKIETNKFIGIINENLRKF